MARFPILLLTIVAAWAADDSWNKVKDLKSGTEIRVLKKRSLTPVLGTFSEAGDDNLILVVKNEQIAIHKDAIDRLDYRPSERRVVKETTTKVEDAGTAQEPKMGMNASPSGPGYSSSTSFNIQGKGEFETLYRRPPPAPKK